MAPVLYHHGRFPPAALDWPRLIPLLGPAAAAVARYDGMLAAVPNPGVLLAPQTSQEAVLSSRIEGTQATMREVMELETGREAASPDMDSTQTGLSIIFSHKTTNSAACGALVIGKTEGDR